jgi:hypothetical protein
MNPAIPCLLACSLLPPLAAQAPSEGGVRSATARTVVIEVRYSIAEGFLVRAWVTWTRTA